MSCCCCCSQHAGPTLPSHDAATVPTSSPENVWLQLPLQAAKWKFHSCQFPCFQIKSSEGGSGWRTHVTFLNVSIRAGIWDLGFPGGARGIEPSGQNKTRKKHKFHPSVGKIPWRRACTVSHQFPLYVEFSRQEYWSGLPFPSPGDFPDPGIKSMSPSLAGGLFTTSTYMLISTVWFGSEAREDHRRNLAGGSHTPLPNFPMDSIPFPPSVGTVSYYWERGCLFTCKCASLGKQVPFARVLGDCDPKAGTEKWKEHMARRPVLSTWTHHCLLSIPGRSSYLLASVSPLWKM